MAVVTAERTVERATFLSQMLILCFAAATSPADIWSQRYAPILGLA